MTGDDRRAVPGERPRVAVLGSMNVDYVTYVDRAPGRGETVLATDAMIVPGGKGANQALILARMGADVAMFGAVGEDANGELVLGHLTSGGVDVAGVVRVDRPTGFATVVVDRTGDNSIVVSGGANSTVAPDYVDRVLPVLARYDVIVMQLEIPLEAVLHAARAIKRLGKTVILDPAPAPASLPDELLASVDILKPNESELRILTGVTDAVGDVAHAARSLLSRGAGCVVASLGEQGALVVVPGADPLVIAAPVVDVVDTTGAGDSLTASLAFGVAAGAAVEDATRFGVLVAADVVQARGAQASVPPAERLRRHWADALRSPRVSA